MPKSIPANISLLSFGKAMAQLDLTGVPPHARKRAVMDHLMRIEEDTVTNAEYATQIAISRRLRDAQDSYNVINPTKDQ